MNIGMEINPVSQNVNILAIITPATAWWKLMLNCVNKIASANSKLPKPPGKELEIPIIMLNAISPVIKIRFSFIPTDKNEK